MATLPTPRAPQLEGFIRSEYSPDQIEELHRLVQPALTLETNALGHVCASNRQEGQDSTNYDAVWVRDSVWAYFALRLQAPQKALTVLKNLIRYYATPAQRRRLSSIISNPQIASGSDGAMEVLHIRFDGRSETFEDVQVGGKPQYWNHKQNDALGLFYLAVGEALESGFLNPKQVTSLEWQTLLQLPTYFDRLEFEKMEDAGAWEEIERVNTSSIALVTYSFEVWKRLLSEKKEIVDFAIAQSGVSEDETLLNGGLDLLIDCGYERLNQQLPWESPKHPRSSARYRQADAALLNLVFPCKLQRLSSKTLVEVLSVVESLAREIGILRYRGDAYQSGNYWISPSESVTEADSRTDDCSAEEDFLARTRRMIPDTEAQWFFDSWMSHAYGRLAKRDGALVAKQIHFFNRALCQLTGSKEQGGDGKLVADFSLPESYNTLVEGEQRRLVPSPITPLNWSKACLTLAFQELRQ